ncbi:MAG: hypothetical protein J07HX64_01119 [halophilic archaeon J07HX64]|nr:MAG: hypothetical protein J07HX64_01119 [halophilic archaeon J07HX64]
MTGRVVRDSEGTRYILEKRSADSSRVRDPETGERLHFPNDSLEPVDASPLNVATDALSGEAVTLVTRVPNERALGLLVDLDERGPTGVRRLLDVTDLCEGDLHGLLAALQAGGLLAEVTVAGERGYETTETASAALDRLR